MFRVLFKIIIIVVEKIISVFALVAAFVSFAQQGRLIQRMLGSINALYDAFYGFGAAYAKNEQFQDVWTRFTAAFDRGLEAAGNNIEAEPSTVFYTFIATFVCFKLAAWALKLFRKNVLKRRVKAIKPPAQQMKPPKAPTSNKKSGTYDRLYEPPELSPSTTAEIDKLKE